MPVIRRLGLVRFSLLCFLVRRADIVQVPARFLLLQVVFDNLGKDGCGRHQARIVKVVARVMQGAGPGAVAFFAMAAVAVTNEKEGSGAAGQEFTKVFRRHHGLGFVNFFFAK